jgi:hypothetical protein
MLKHFSEVAPTCFGPYVRPSSGGSRAVLCAVTKFDSVDVRSLCVCAVCVCMSLPSVCVCVSGAPVRVRSGQRIIEKKLCLHV